MKVLKVYEDGRMPLWMKDFEYLQESYQEMIVGLAGSLKPQLNYFIISGCSVKVAGGLARVSAGFVYLNGDILRVEATDLDCVGLDPTIILNKETRYYAEGDRAFIMLDGTTDNRQCYKEDVLVPAILDSSSTGVGGVFWFKKNAWTLFDFVRGGIADQSTWKPTDNSNRVFYKRLGSIVYLRGLIMEDVEGENVSGTYGTVPQPSESIVVRLSDDVKVEANGTLTVTSDKIRLIFDGMSYIADNPFIDNVSARQGFFESTTANPNT